MINTRVTCVIANNHLNLFCIYVTQPVHAEINSGSNSSRFSGLRFAKQILSAEIQRVQTGGPVENKFTEVHREFPQKITQQVLIPIKEFPKVCIKWVY